MKGLELARHLHRAICSPASFPHLAAPRNQTSCAHVLDVQLRNKPANVQRDDSDRVTRDNIPGAIRLIRAICNGRSSEITPALLAATGPEGPSTSDDKILNSRLNILQKNNKDRSWQLWGLSKFLDPCKAPVVQLQLNFCRCYDP